jgi:hypothetical protein
MFLSIYFCSTWMNFRNIILNGEKKIPEDYMQYNSIFIKPDSFLSKSQTMCYLSIYMNVQNYFVLQT